MGAIRPDVPKFDVDIAGNCSRCGGLHYGTGRTCVYDQTFPEPEWKKCPQCGRENSLQTWEKFGGKCPNCSDLHERDKLHNAPTMADCRWCDKKIVFVWEKWQHLTKQEQRECPTPLPFEEQLPVRVYKPIEYDEMPSDMVTLDSLVESQHVIQNLVMLLRRFVVRVSLNGDDGKGKKLCDQTMDYLRRSGLANPTDILRKENSIEPLG